jgi:hypothetical protein
LNNLITSLSLYFLVAFLQPGKAYGYCRFSERERADVVEIEESSLVWSSNKQFGFLVVAVSLLFVENQPFLFCSSSVLGG